ncbi:MAG: hypothetical protein S4CHLAM7_04190 [Chlamydiae bacterium]|nr:hypothetical protein [Chlamydiota bacterium]
MRFRGACIMRWNFHRERNKKYNIAIQGLRDSFLQQEGWEFMLTLHELDKNSLTLDEVNLIKAFNKLVSCLFKEGKNPRKQHVKLSKQLRFLLNYFKKDSAKVGWKTEFQHMLLNFCCSKYYQTHFYSFGQGLLESLFSSLTFSSKDTPESEHFSNYNFLDEADLIEKSKPFLFIEREIRKFDENLLKRCFDSHQYNLPFLLYTMAVFRQGKLAKVKMVRMGCPTRESWIEKPKVIGEFEGFLAKLQLENKSHIYINKQKTWGDEGKRSREVKALESRYNNFSCVCIPSDGDFYFQQGRFQNLRCMDQFKMVFYRMLFEQINSGYYYLPTQWKKDPLFQKGVRQVIEEVHTLYYSSKNELESAERSIFIDLTYTHLILYFLQYSSCQSINITCRDGIDRAGCEQSKLLYYFQVALGIEEELESAKELQFVHHFPVYQAKSRAIVPARRKFLFKVFKAFTPSIKSKINEQHQVKPILHSKPHFVKRVILKK